MLDSARIEKDLNLLRRDSASIILPSTAEQVSLSSSQPPIITLSTTSGNNANNLNLANKDKTISDTINVSIAHNESYDGGLVAYNNNNNNNNMNTAITTAGVDIASTHTSPLDK